MVLVDLFINNDIFVDKNGFFAKLGENISSRYVNEELGKYYVC